MNALYPLKFNPIYKQKIWGGSKLKNILKKDSVPEKCGESWELSCVQGDISVVANGFLSGNNLQELIEVYMGGLTGDKIFDRFGVEFPLLIKFIDASDVLSIQVHPDDMLASARHNTLGKTEMWYIIQSEENAELISGFKKELNKEIYLHHLKNKTLKDILNFEKVEKDNVFFIPSGRVHAICKGILLTEIQQTSDITYRIYDWDRLDSNGKSRELHAELAVDAIDYKFYKDYKTNYISGLNTASNIINCNYFTTNIIEFDKTIERDYKNIDSFRVYICIDGKCSLIYENDKKETIKTGETVLIPASLSNIHLKPETKTKILEVYID